MKSDYLKVDFDEEEVAAAAATAVQEQKQQQKPLSRKKRLAVGVVAMGGALVAVLGLSGLLSGPPPECREAVEQCLQEAGCDGMMAHRARQQCMGICFEASCLNLDEDDLHDFAREWVSATDDGGDDSDVVAAEWESNGRGPRRPHRPRPPHGPHGPHRPPHDPPGPPGPHDPPRPPGPPPPDSPPGPHGHRGHGGAEEPERRDAACLEAMKLCAEDRDCSAQNPSCRRACAHDVNVTEACSS